MTERVRSTFMEDFRVFMEETVPENRREFARFSDVSEKQFSSLGTNRERIKRYLEEGMT